VKGENVIMSDGMMRRKKFSKIKKERKEKMAENQIGVIYTVAEADQQFGDVVSSVQISSSQLKDFIGQTDKYLMFKIINGVLYILGDGRSVLVPSEGYVDPDEIFTVYSKSKVDELIDTGGEETNLVEIRNNVLTVTNGQYTLESGSWCPPLCS
jgi:hypothetical protein